MIAAQFLEPYQHDLPPTAFEPETTGVDLAEARRWSQWLGQTLYDRLSGQPLDRGEQTRCLQAYYLWGSRHHHAILKDIYDSDDESAYRALYELTGHTVNLAMAHQWGELSKTTSGGNRQQAISNAQDPIAIEGLAQYAVRESGAAKTADYEYFYEENRQLRHTFEGCLSIMDSAVVLLQMMRIRPDYVVVGAPLQFQRYAKPTVSTDQMTSKSNNVDFVVMNTKTDDALGIEVKSLVTNQDRDRHDVKRNVLIDTSRDFGTERVMRTESRSTKMRTVSWGGLLCVQQVASMKMARNKRSRLEIPPYKLHGMIQQAKQLDHFSPLLGQAVERITARIDGRFAETMVGEEGLEPSRP